jgi:deoxyribonuclease-4
MKFGSHVSASGGVWNAPLNAATIGCEVFQFFSRPPQGGNAPKLTDETIAKFREACGSGGFDTWAIHAPYIINFASSTDRIREGSIRMIREELERGSQLGARAVMFHPGSAKDVGPEKGVAMVAAGVRELLKGYKGSTQLLIEISAGSGSVIGANFEQVAEILKGVPDSVGVCFDTAHAFASGYDLRTAKDVKATFGEFDRLIGLDRLVMSHCNDSKVELGAKKDRHDHLGEGHIGLGGFSAMLADKRLSHFFWIVETPPEGQEEDLKKLKKLRSTHAKI